jgi:hypothetical protein
MYQPSLPAGNLSTQDGEENTSHFRLKQDWINNQLNRGKGAAV